MSSIAIVVGVPGVGKTTIISKAIEKLRNLGYQAEIINYGDVMLMKAVELGYVKNRDEMRKLPITKQLYLQRVAAEWISKKSEEVDLILLDTHLFIRTPRGRWPGLSENNIPYLKGIVQLILIEADPHDISFRRQRDKTRIRSDYGDVKEIDEDQIFNRYLSASISIKYGCPVYILVNEEGKIPEVVEKLVKVLENIIIDSKVE
ncbi:TPA: adenylate kinase [Candidatus Geothermarchaeota archaeon]|nr:adenylate kinase [Candidatus Geothermarchaeota archaeon]HIQ12826.1 adenylate kinase [Thermoprotei archaeon]